MRILFIVPYPTEGPSNRYRVEQFLPYLEKEGIGYTLRPFISSDFFKILYKNYNYEKKILYFFHATAKRLCDVIKSLNYDIVFIHIESFPFGPAVLEYFFAKFGKKIIFDFEDAVYLKNFKGENKIINFLRWPNKFYNILGLSNHVIVCNKYMKELVYPYCPNVTVIPTSIDTEKFKLKDYEVKKSKIIIGWIGSHTTFYCLKSLTKVFATLAKKFDFSLKIIGGGEYLRIPGVDVINEKWTLEKDIENFQGLDIGIYPLLDDERAMAKTPFKTIQYMSVGVPTVVSRVKGNIDIIKDGVNGFLADSPEDWITKLSLLIEDNNLRRKIGFAGRITAEGKYSLKVNTPKFLEVIQKVYNQGNKN